MYLTRVSERAWLTAFRSDAATWQDGLCAYCTEPLTWETKSADHVHPRSQGGKTERSNIKASCHDCNVAKGSMPVKAFLAAMREPDHTMPFNVWLAHMRWRLWKRTHLACRRIERAVT
jgi:5-methylcytosine-specific restriction endonuclease McrA